MVAAIASIVLFSSRGTEIRIPDDPGGCMMSGSSGRTQTLGSMIDANFFPQPFQNGFRYDVASIRNVLGVDAPLVIVTDSTDFSDNAQAISPGASINQTPSGIEVDHDGKGDWQVPNARQGRDGSVFFCNSLLNSLYTKGESWGVISVAAHEFAHILQMKNGLDITRIAQEVGSVKKSELDADFLSGYVMARRSMVIPTDLRDMSFAVYDTGDTQFTDMGHHGTSEERLAAFQAGMRVWQMDSNFAYQAGLAYVGITPAMTSNMR